MPERKNIVERLFKSLWSLTLVLPWWPLFAYRQGSPMAGWAIAVAVAATGVPTAFAIAAIRKRNVNWYYWYAVGYAISAVVGLYAGLYYLFGTPEHFGVHLTRLDATYFSVTTFATVGYGDITPKTQLARAIATCEIAVSVFVIVGLVGLALGRSGSEKKTPHSE